MVAFEGSDAALALNDREFAKPGGRFELKEDLRRRTTLVRQFVNPFTVARELRRLGVPEEPLLLKIDIDSVDVHAFDAVTRHFRPWLVWVEKQSSQHGLHKRGRAVCAVAPPPCVWLWACRRGCAQARRWLWALGGGGAPPGTADRQAPR